MVWVVRYADFISFFLKYPIKMKKIGPSETKLFHFLRIFETGWMGVGSGVQANF